MRVWLLYIFSHICGTWPNLNQQRNIWNQERNSSCHFRFCVFYFLFSSYKRYFYCHDVTGMTRWDYPDGPEPDSHTQEEQRCALNGDTIEYQSLKASVTPEQSSLSAVCAGEPLPPGVDPPLPAPLSADILALAGCPPPPPPDDAEIADEHLDASPPSDEEQLPGSAIPDPDPAYQQDAAEISALPVLNRPVSPETTDPSAVIGTSAAEYAQVSSPTRTQSPAHRGTSPSISTTDDTAVHQHRERRRKKEKVTAAFEYCSVFSWYYQPAVQNSTLKPILYYIRQYRWYSKHYSGELWHLLLNLNMLVAVSENMLVVKLRSSWVLANAGCPV